MSLDGEVLKSLVILPVEHNTEDVATQLRSELISSGFIIVREETRKIDPDLASKLGGGAAIVGASRLIVVARVEATTQLAKFVTSSAHWSEKVQISVDHEETSKRLLLLFPRMIVDPIPTNAAARDYCDKELKTILVRGLTLAAKQKPDNAVKFLAEYLLENNPRAPKISFHE